MNEENCIGKWYILPNSDKGENCIPKNAVFHIPFYQRGYRWTAKNVEKLIKDLCTFSDNEYCLQPIVLQKLQTQGDKKVYRVVDGQQRLTTIYILLKVLNEFKVLNKSPLWNIYYESEGKDISKLLTQETTTINDYFRNNARETAGKVFKKVSNLDNLDKLKEKLKQTAFLIYEIPTNDETDPKGHKAFLRLNDGKTPLTSSELIRALYMVNDSGISEQNKIEISKEWELIETTLRNEQFWLMLNAKGLEDSPTRLDLLFALVSNVDLKSNVDLNVTKANPRVVFEVIENSTQPLDAIWHEIMKCFWWMQSCYQDIEIYNYLCWIAKFTNKDAQDIYNVWKANTSNTSFKEALIDIIKTEFKDILSLDDIRYGDAGFLRKLFVLLNCLECNNTKERFRFDLYNQESWDIEHIDSQTPNDLKDLKQMKAWLEASYNELSDQQKKKIENFYNFDKDNQFDHGEDNLEADFKNLADSIINALSNKEVGETEKIDNDSKDKLGNLALLSSSVNRSYHNDIFPVKRKKIRDAIVEGNSYIPPCTQKAFMKFYTEQPSKITYWLKADFDAYTSHMKKLYEDFKEITTETIDKENRIDSQKSKNENDSKILIINDVENNVEDCQAPKENAKMDFLRLMGDYNIIIPKIQRPYVQGRLDKYGKKCLEGFASELVKYIFDENEHSLDFIYGIESKDKKTFYPIDGQQRLTTLLLLAWLCKKNESDWVFQYESRRMVECFIEALLKSNPPSLESQPSSLGKNAKKEYSSQCSDYIKNSDWFQLSWANDPGIAAMLEMLDSLYDKLLKKRKETPSTSPSMERITFYIQYLDVSSKSYDQIFLKMNSRGKELTVWENIKAVLDQYAPDDWKEKINNIWPEKLWPLIPEEKKDIKHVDKKLLLITELALECAGYTKKIENTYILNQWLNSEKEARKKFFRINSIFFNQLESNICESLNEMTPEWAKDTIKINYQDSNETYETFYKPLLVHYALLKVCPYMSKDWPRIVWNILENNHFDKSKFKDAFDLIDELSNHSNDILKFLAEDKNVIESKFAKEQVDEERVKAILIRNSNEWIEIIQNAEKFAFFKGAIRFLYTNEKGEVNWNLDTFNTKFSKARKYFDSDGIQEDKQVELIKTFVLLCKNWDNQLYDQQIFSPNKSTWKQILCSNTWHECIHQILTNNELPTESSLESNDQNVKNYLPPTLKEMPYEYIIKNLPEGRFRWNYGRLAFYKPRARDAIVMDWKDFSRNKTLAELEVESKQKINDVPFFWGWDIKFKYNGSWFLWKYDDYVYLLDGKNYLIKKSENSQGGEKEQFYCFKAKDPNGQNLNTESFLAKLKELLNDAPQPQTNEIDGDGV